MDIRSSVRSGNTVLLTLGSPAHVLKFILETFACMSPRRKPCHIAHMTKLHLTTVPAKPTRLSAKLREAIDLRVRKGMTIKEAAQQAGMSEAGYHKAMKRPAVQEHLLEVQQRFIAEAESLRALGKARAIEAAMDLMQNAKSEAIRARMAEFLLSGGKTGQQVNVHVDARQGARPLNPTC